MANQKLNLRVKLLHFSEGIAPLGSRMSISADPTPGVPTAERIVRIPGGYLVGWGKRLFVVNDAKVLCAEVEDLSADAAEPVPEAPTVEAPPPSAQVFGKSEAELRAAAAKAELQRQREEDRLRKQEAPAA